MRYQLIQELAVKAQLFAARELLDSGDTDQAERIFKSALSHAEGLAGEGSPLTGLVLLDLTDLYERQGKKANAAKLECRIIKILRVHSILVLNQLN